MLSKNMNYLFPDGEKDRTEEITKLLESGVCRLAPGDFFVSGILMPEKSMLAGSGAATRVILFDSVEKGYAVRMQTLCTVKDLSVVGSLGETELVPETGERHGILWQGNYNTDKTDFPRKGTVENLHITGFNGGGITEYNTGYSSEGCLNVSDTYITNCNAGINIAYWSEFNRYTNVHSRGNYYGCINNGGNNLFVNCCFTSNVLLYLMDNTDSKSPNNSHGNVIGCTFNHADHNKGIGIRMIKQGNGYSFVGCQMFFAKIDITDSPGTVITGTVFGKDIEIKAHGKGYIGFSDCTFTNQPIVEKDEDTLLKFNNCYTRQKSDISEIC